MSELRQQSDSHRAPAALVSYGVFDGLCISTTKVAWRSRYSRGAAPTCRSLQLTSSPSAACAMATWSICRRTARIRMAGAQATATVAATVTATAGAEGESHIDIDGSGPGQ